MICEVIKRTYQKGNSNDKFKIHVRYSLLFCGFREKISEKVKFNWFWCYISTTQGELRQMSNSIFVFDSVTSQDLKKMGFYTRDVDGCGNIFEISDDDGNSMGVALDKQGCIDYIFQKGETFDKVLVNILKKKELNIISEDFDLFYIFIGEHDTSEITELRKELSELLVKQTWDMVGYKSITEEQLKRIDELTDKIDDLSETKN